MCANGLWQNWGSIVDGRTDTPIQQLDSTMVVDADLQCENMISLGLPLPSINVREEVSNIGEDPQ